MTTATSQAEGEEVIPATADEDLGPDVMGDGLSVQHHLLTTVNHFTQCGFRQLVTCRPTVIPADVQQLVLIKEGTPEEWKPIVDQQNPEPLNMKVEEEELWTSLEEDQLNVKEETDATRFSATAVPPKSESDEEKPLFSQLHQHQMEVGDLPTSSSTDQMILSASCGDDCEGAGTTRNPDLKTDDDDSNSSETEDSENYEEDEDSESELKDSSKSWSNIEEEDSNWKESRTPESGLNPANKSFSCSKSGTEFVDSQSFLRHVTSHSRIKSSSCFGNKRSLKVKKVHKTQKTFSCDDCGKKFTRKDNLNTHLRFHKGVKPFSCEICGRRFNQKSNLVTHKRIHTGEKPFACDFCGQRFNQKSGLNSHMTSHIGQKPFACEVCGQTFCRKGHLKSHMRIHTGEKCFECDVCGQKFSLKSSLNAHTTIHTGQKPFSCDVCGQTFRQKNTLGNHMRIHTGQKPFGCKVCGQMFRQKAHVENHLRIHTRNSNSSDDATSI